MRSRIRRALVVAMVAVGAAVPVTLATAKSTHRHHAKKHHKHHKHHKKHSACSPTPSQQGAIDAATTAFINHLYAAHLSTSPSDQVNALVSNPSNYVEIHTALVEAMATPALSSAESVGTALQEVTQAFWAHIYSAHLQQSPAQQLNALVSNPNNYALMHTVWIQTMSTPLSDWLETFIGGSPGSGCSSSGSSGSGSTKAGGKQSVMIMNSAFSPNNVTVNAGTKVTWSNMDSVAHTVTSNGGGRLNSPNIPPNGSWSYTFTKAGTYHYYCAIHPNMTGTVTVQ